MNKKILKEGSCLKPFFNKNAQGSIELMLLISFLAAAFIVFLVFLTNQYTNSELGNEFLMLQDLSKVISKEMKLAASANDGYNRTFKLPEKINGKDYEIIKDVTKTSILIQTIEATKTRSKMAGVLVPLFEGELNPGKNIIVKTNGIIFVNH